MRILVYGRGSSLSCINHDALKKKFDHVFLVNEFDTFVDKDENLQNFLKNNNIIQFTNISQEGLTDHFINSLNVQKIYLTALKPNGSGNFWRNRRFFSNTLQKNAECCYVHDDCEPYMELVKGTSEVALISALAEYKAKEIYTIGIDFYQSKYHLKIDDWAMNRAQRDYTNPMLEAHKNIIAKFPKVKFTYITSSNFNSNLKNHNCIYVCDSKDNEEQ